MALLEKRKASGKLDDTIPLTCIIEGRDKKDSYVVSNFSAKSKKCYYVTTFLF
jgi:6,7-dimethyl-8-ribityllumazine synthase